MKIALSSVAALALHTFLIPVAQAQDTGCDLKADYKPGECVSLTRKYELKTEIRACDPSLQGSALAEKALCPKDSNLPMRLDRIDPNTLTDEARTEVAAVRSLGPCRAAETVLPTYGCVKGQEQSLQDAVRDLKDLKDKAESLKDKAENLKNTAKNLKSKAESATQTLRSVKNPSLPSLGSTVSGAASSAASTASSAAQKVKQAESALKDAAASKIDEAKAAANQAKGLKPADAAKKKLTQTATSPIAPIPAPIATSWADARVPQAKASDTCSLAGGNGTTRSPPSRFRRGRWARLPTEPNGSPLGPVS